MKKIWIAIVKMLGWDFRLPEPGSRPELERCVFAVAPHTAVSDFLIGAAYLWSLDTNGHIFIKKEFFVWPIGGLLRKLGGIPIDRGNRKNDMIGRAVAEFAKGEVFSLAITPEGTRKPVKRWKRGFWEIAHQAGVPIVPACIDFGRKRIWLDEAIWTTDDYEADVARVKRYFRAEMAKRPGQFVEV
ncbi:MAG: 1-acyl-sn-glycerol-3-phosphate acyltransferase [Bacteroidales bacterium]|nr:1-acyl-sn-glycerol-3-phosphate acyltransferase [Bacteroidales bacterium]